MNKLDQNTLVRLSRLLTVSAILVGVGISVLLGGGMYAQVGAAAADLLTKQNRGTLTNIRNELRKGPQNKEAPKAGSFQIVVDFQGMAKQAAQLHKCALNFDSVGDAQPYLSKYNNETSPDWKMVEISMTVNGDASDVMSLINEFQSFAVPYELGDFEMSRGSLNNPEGVAAKFGVKVLFRA